MSEEAWGCDRSPRSVVPSGDGRVHCLDEQLRLAGAGACPSLLSAWNQVRRRNRPLFMNRALRDNYQYPQSTLPTAVAMVFASKTFQPVEKGNTRTVAYGASRRSGKGRAFMASQRPRASAPVGQPRFETPVPCADAVSPPSVVPAGWRHPWRRPL